MAEPQVGATIEELELADRKAARLLRKTLGAGESVDTWAMGLDDQVVALTARRTLIAKHGFRAGAPLGGRVASFDYCDIIAAEVRLGTATSIFEITAEGMPDIDASAYRGRRSRVNELPNGLTIAGGQVADFRRLVVAIGERVRQARGPSRWIPPPP